MLTEIVPPARDPGLCRRLRARLDALAKPPGALGRLEDLAVALGVAQGTERPAADPARLLIFAGDHGIVAEGVSAWPQAVTAAMVRTFLAERAAANALARAGGVGLTVFDAGLAVPLADPRLASAGIRAGTRNAATEAALTAAERDAALAFGAAAGAQAVAEGARLVALGEMGIGNSSAAALVGAAVTGVPVGALTGSGAGPGPGGLEAKRAVLERAAARGGDRLAGAEALRVFGGLEMAAMAGALIGAAGAGAAVLIDGFIATAAAAAAIDARPDVRPLCLFAHRGAEPGHPLLLTHLGAEPILDLRLRLGEGTGALLAVPILRAAAAVLSEMATLEEALAAAEGR